MFRRKKKGASDGNDSTEEAVGSETPKVAEADTEVDAPPPPPEPVAAESGDGNDAGDPTPSPVATESGPGDGDYEPGYVDDHLPPRVWVESVLDTRSPPSRDELERQAAADFQAAIAPSLEKLREVVPEASSPEEARHALEERQGEFLPDPEGERLWGSDRFKTEASIHYRIQKQLERPRGRVGWGQPWTPPEGLARPARRSSRPSLGRGGD